MRKRLVIEVSEKFHRDIKKRAAAEGLSIKDFVLKALLKEFT